MVKIVPKGKNIALSEHFFSNDFDCHCVLPECKRTYIELDLLSPLEALWNNCGGFIVDSGYRCEAHNKEIGGAKDSQHLLGGAADCKSVKKYNGALMATYAEKILLFRKGGIGIYPAFVHVDIRKGPARWGNPKKC